LLFLPVRIVFCGYERDARTSGGDHTVRDNKGSTTYKENPNNPNKNSQGKGFETTKKVDYEGAAHESRSTGKDVPTPHVHENKDVRPAIPGKDMPLNK
jgi:hypothetical protein